MTTGCWIGQVWALLVIGCAPLPAATIAVPASRFSSAQSEVQRGPVRVRITLTPREVSLSDTLQLTLRIELEEGVSILKTTVDAVLDVFVIRDVQESPPRVENRRRVFQQVYVLEPTRLGRLQLAPIHVTFRDLRRGDEGEQAVQTEPLKFDVTTIVDSKELSLAQLRPLASGVEPPGDRGSLTGWLLGGLTILMGLGIVSWRRRIAARKGANHVHSPQELARIELGQVFHQDLIEQDVKLFYVELTDVVRRYLERSLRVSARQQTTEEFLHALSAEESLGLERAQQLRAFLETADQVKFAARRPSSDDVEMSIHLIRHFLGLNASEVLV